MDFNSEEQLSSLKEGMELFNQREFYEAHEFFEILWQQAGEESEREEFLFLVRIAAAGVHLTNENYSSLFLFQLAQKQLAGKPEFQFIEGANLSEQLDSVILQLEKSARADLKQISRTIDFQLKLKNEYES